MLEKLGGKRWCRRKRGGWRPKGGARKKLVGERGGQRRKAEVRKREKLRGERGDQR